MYANAHSLNIAWDHPAYLTTLNQSDMVCADGVSVVWAGRFLGGNGLHKASGTEWIEAFCNLANAEQWRIYILAGRPGVAEQARANLQGQWPGINIIGTADGFFQGKSEEETLQDIERSAPDILFVGMGTPKQELWISQNRPRISAPVCWAVGSLFDLITGEEQWPPQWINAIGMQWFWRLLLDPVGKWRRYVLGNPVFVYRVLRQRINGAGGDK
jgi:N-acetylglucosaminyldiphosphoundecaprenol N-acetyl-beta-D-mannosaminyltransferase